MSRAFRNTLFTCFNSNVGLSYDQARSMLADVLRNPEEGAAFVAQLGALLREKASSFREKSMTLLEEPWQTEEDARDFFTFIWETVTDEPWPADIPKGNGERFKPKPGHARGY